MNVVIVDPARIRPHRYAHASNLLYKLSGLIRDLGARQKNYRFASINKSTTSTDVAPWNALALS